MSEDPPNRDRDAEFEAVFTATYGSVLAYARRRVGVDADDVVAETFAVAWRRLDDIPTGNPLPWLYGVARRVVSESRRAGRRRDALSARLQWEAVHAPIHDLFAGTTIFDSLARLSPHDREVILLVAWDELDAAQAAKALGCSTVAYRVRLHRARKRLRSSLERSRVEDATRARVTHEART